MTVPGISNMLLCFEVWFEVFCRGWVLHPQQYNTSIELVTLQGVLTYSTVTILHIGVWRELQFSHFVCVCAHP